jgi:hypothetical protein
VADSLVIPRRFNGPPDSGHGGYSSGLLGTLVEGPADVALRAPPPLEKQLAVERRDDGSMAARDGDELVMEARPAALDLELPRALSVAKASEGPQAYVWHDWHPFPTCFACGPRRDPGEGLRLFAGPVGAGDILGVDWTPAAEFAGEGGTVDPLFVWAALDCPGGAAAANEPDQRAPVVLASFLVDVREPVKVGKPHAIAAWRIATDGRKRWIGAALWDEKGALKAAARALWIELPH